MMPQAHHALDLKEAKRRGMSRADLIRYAVVVFLGGDSLAEMRIGRRRDDDAWIH